MNHTLMNPEAVAWLNQFSGLPLDDGQRLTLVYLRYHDRMSNSDYRRMNRIDALTSGQELRGLVQSGLVEQRGVGRGTHYALKAPKEILGEVHAETVEEKILHHIQEHGSISNRGCKDLLKVDLQRASYLLKKLTKERGLKPEGTGRWRRYRLM